MFQVSSFALHCVIDFGPLILPILQFSDSDEIEKLSADFEMVNTEDNDEPQGDQYQPDGGYIPRILFLNSEGKVQAQIKDTARTQYQYFYPSATGVIGAMNNAKKTFSDELWIIIFNVELSAQSTRQSLDWGSSKYWSFKANRFNKNTTVKD